MKRLMKKNMKNKFKLAIFDMDGLLVDSEIHWNETYPAIWGKFGVKYSKRLGKEILGLSVPDAVKFINRKYGKKIPVARVKKAFKSQRKLVYTEKSNLLPGALKLIQVLKKYGVKVALASGASFESIGRVMDKHKLHNFFELKFSTIDMNFPGKPNPAVYKAVIKNFKVRPGSTVVFEDSLVGVQAGKASGAKVIAVPDKRWSHGDFSIANLTAKSLADKRIYKFLGI